MTPEEAAAAGVAEFQAAMNAPSMAAALAEATAELIAAAKRVMQLTITPTYKGAERKGALRRAAEDAALALENWRSADKEQG